MQSAVSTSLLGRDEAASHLSPMDSSIHEHDQFEERRHHLEEMEEASLQEKLFKICSFFGFQFTILFPLLLLSSALFIFFMSCVFTSSFDDNPLSFPFPFFNTNVYLSLCPCVLSIIFLFLSIGDQLLQIIFPLRSISDTLFWQYNQSKYTKATVWIAINFFICLIEVAMLLLCAVLVCVNMICFFVIPQEWIAGTVWAFFLLGIIWKCVVTIHHPLKWTIKSIILIQRQSQDIQWKMLKQFQFLHTLLEKEVKEEEVKSRKLKQKLQHHHSSLLYFLFFHGNEIVFLIRFIFQLVILTGLFILLLVVTTNNTLNRVSNTITGSESWNSQTSKLITLPSSTTLHIQCQGNLNSNQTLFILESDVGMIPFFLWSPLLQSMSQLSRTCIYERGGYGYSTNGKFPRTLSTMANELYELLIQSQELKTNNTQSIVLISQSYGTRISRQFAQLYPKYIKGLVLIDPPIELQQNSSFAIVEAFRNEITEKEWNGIVWESFGTSKQNSYFHVRNEKFEKRVIGTSMPFFMTGNTATYDLEQMDWKWQPQLQRQFSSNRYLLADYFEKYFANSHTELSTVAANYKTTVIVNDWYQFNSCEAIPLLQVYMKQFLAPNRFSIEQCNAIWKPFQSQLLPLYTTHLQRFSSTPNTNLQIWSNTSPYIAWHKPTELVTLLKQQFI